MSSEAKAVPNPSLIQLPPVFIKSPGGFNGAVEVEAHVAAKTSGMASSSGRGRLYNQSTNTRPSLYSLYTVLAP